jgi:hypothetical protein
MQPRSEEHRNKYMQSILVSRSVSNGNLAQWTTGNLLFGVLQMQFIRAIDAARFTDGCDKLPEIHES